MDQSKTDLVMKFTITPEHDVPSEGVLDIHPEDTLMKDFHGAPYQDYSNFFEVTDFNMNMKLKSEDDHQDKMMVSPHGHASTPHAQHVARHVNNGSTDQWSRWRSAAAGGKFEPYPFEMENLTFQRVIDSASPIFFMYCCKQQKFHSAVLVKRLAQGHATIPKAYLRIEFTDVTITDIGWDDGDLVKETCEFNSKGGMKITYLRQRADASLFGKPAFGAEWLGDDDPKRGFGVRSGGRRS
jgi:type VI protein secretion system component Hcp